jgi:RsmE family RNA methyltransferase
MNICLFSHDEINLPLSIKDPRGQHLIKVLHKKAGDSFACGEIGGMAGTAEIVKIENEQIEFSFTPQTDGKKLFPLSMIIGFPRPIQLKRLLRDMAALGVECVHLCATELTEKSYLDSDLAKTNAGYQMLLDGTVQAGSTHVPQLVIHKSLKECLEKIDKNCSLYALDNVNPVSSLMQEIQKAPEKAVAAIGSERGWTDRERKMLVESGFVLLGMGNRIMRTETAATVSASLILGAMGKLN